MGPRVFSRGNTCRPVNWVGDVCPATGDVNVQRVCQCGSACAEGLFKVAFHHCVLCLACEHLTQLLALE